MVGQSVNEQRARLLDIDHQGKERFFFLTEMRHARRPEKVDKRLGGTARIRIVVCSAPEPPCLDQSMVVVVAESGISASSRFIVGT